MTFEKMKTTFYGIKSLEKTEVTAQAVLDNVNGYIALLEMRKRAGDSRAMLKINKVYNDLSIFDWWKDDLSLTQLKDMKRFLEEAIKLGYTGYVSFKVGVSGCANGMWADTELSEDGFSPRTGMTLYKSFTPAYNYWSFTDEEGRWIPEDEKEYNSLDSVRKLEKAFREHFGRETVK